ncbi:hypothetical protein JY97_15035 [Alkalispirochaeta odontotermitis]|uniref:TRAP transporter substrate-binding protein DctP n=1 Tax=Olavius algarvensis spirochete endosymbiont TaxID=260710 RepID=UPI00052BD286|nr:TRAP transporter substrate-binding protein DctP [Olavius algarvensis spirochete endosymbiont]KGM38651.1 hypothetical protein JY97_15035 [Alkalispirochaeta odontotermitis]
MILTKGLSLCLKISGKYWPFLNLATWKKKLALYLMFVLLCLAENAWALTIKLASPFPEATEWHNSLLRMAEEWSAITDGLVKVKIYPGGIAGKEGDIIRKMRMGQLDSGIFSAFGLQAIVPETLVLTLPGLIQNEEELNFILDNFVWRFDERFHEEGFAILAWVQSGWANVYSSTPVTNLTEFKKLHLPIDNTESATVSGFKTLGFNIVPVGMNEIIVALQTGLIDSVTASPMIAAAFQWFALVPYMTNLNLSPIIGGLMLNRKVWLQVPSEYRSALRASMVRTARAFNSASVRLNDVAMTVMKDNGLQMVVLNEDARHEWYDAMIGWHDLAVGSDKIIPTEIYEKLLDELEKLRNR